MNKRGILMFYVLIFTVLSISVAIGVFYMVEKDKHTFEIGEVPSKVIKSYISVYEEGYLLESQLKEKSVSSINKTLNNAGLKDPIYNGEYVLWKKDKECFPNDWVILKNVLISDLGDNYEVFRGNNNLTVRFSKLISKEFEGKGFNLNHSKNFKADYVFENFNFDDFIAKADKIKEIVEECFDLESCWTQKFSNLYGYSFKKEGNLFKVSFTTQSLEGNLVIKVGIDFEEELNIGEEELKC